MKARLNVDGGARGNPGPAAAGAVLKELETDALKTASKVLGEATNNVAEYQGLILGLDLAVSNGVKELDIFADSELMVKQVRGEYRVKNQDLRKLHAAVKERLENFQSWSINAVPRAQNAEADALVNQALDADV